MTRATSAKGSAYCATLPLYTMIASGLCSATPFLIAACKAGSSNAATDSALVPTKANAARIRLCSGRTGTAVTVAA